MILFKVFFEKNVAVRAEFTQPTKMVEWKDHPYTILSLEVYASNNLDALVQAQAKAKVLLKTDA